MQDKEIIVYCCHVSWVTVPLYKVEIMHLCIVDTIEDSIAWEKATSVPLQNVASPWSLEKRIA